MDTFDFRSMKHLLYFVWHIAVFGALFGFSIFPRKKKLVPWKLWHVTLFLFALFLIVTLLLFMHFEPLTTFFSIFIFYVSLVLYAGMKYSWKSLGFKKPSLRDIGLVFILFLLYPLIFYPFIRSITRLFPLTPLWVIIALIVAPVGEEVLFRSLLLQSFMEIMPFWPAVLMVSFISLGFHGFFSPGVSSVFLLNLILGYIFFRTRSVVPCMVYHFLWNLYYLFLLTRKI